MCGVKAFSVKLDCVDAHMNENLHTARRTCNSHSVLRVKHHFNRAVERCHYSFRQRAGSPCPCRAASAANVGSVDLRGWNRLFPQSGAYTCLHTAGPSEEASFQHPLHGSASAFASGAGRCFDSLFGAIRLSGSLYVTKDTA
jgi:hypothetical protein